MSSAGSSFQNPKGQKTQILDRLLAEGRLSPDQYDSVVLQMQRTRDPVEDAILDIGILSEQDLLTYLAKLAGVRFVVTEKLARASISKEVLSMLPIKVVEKLSVCPLLLNAQTHTLTVVTSDLTAFEVAQQVQLITQMRSVQVLLARPAAVRALIQKHYQGKQHAFGELLAQSILTANSAADVFGFGGGLGGMGGMGPARASSPQQPAPNLPNSANLGGAPQAAGNAPPPVPAQTFIIEAPDLKIQAPVHAVEERKNDRPSNRPRVVGVLAVDTEVPFRDYLETVRAFVELMETPQGSLRGHSGHVARFLERLCAPVGLSDRELRGLLLAAYIHDLGKGQRPHLTAWNVRTDAQHRAHAEKSFRAPLRLLEKVGLPRSTEETISHLYEAYDGSGFPDQIAGEKIPFGARVLAIAETYMDLTTNPQNPFQGILDPKDACERIKSLRGSLFDPELVDVLYGVVLGIRPSEKPVKHTSIRGVAGSLSEMSLPDMLQVFSHGRKNGRLLLRAHGQEGQIHFSAGEVHHAALGTLTGPEAFYAMLLLNEGDFSLDPAFKCTERTIHDSTESLLLEGMRRMDETR